MLPWMCCASPTPLQLLSTSPRACPCLNLTGCLLSILYVYTVPVRQVISPPCSACPPEPSALSHLHQHAERQLGPPGAPAVGALAAQLVQVRLRNGKCTRGRGSTRKGAQPAAQWGTVRTENRTCCLSTLTASTTQIRSEPCSCARLPVALTTGSHSTRALCTQPPRLTRLLNLLP